MADSRHKERCDAARRDRLRAEGRKAWTMPRKGVRKTLTDMIAASGLRVGVRPALVIDEHGNFWG